MTQDAQPSALPPPEPAHESSSAGSAKLSPAPHHPTPSIKQLAAFFLKLGTLTFGGPAAHLAVMEDEVVRRRRWLDSEDFLDLLAVSNLLPGPSSTELAIFIGYRVRGVAGLLLSGGCFILPAFLMVAALAWVYVRYQSLPAVSGVLYGVKPIVIAIVVQALWRLGKSAVKTRMLAVIGILALLASLFGASPLVVLSGALVIAGAIYTFSRRLAARVLPALLMLAAVVCKWIAPGGAIVATASTTAPPAARLSAGSATAPIALPATLPSALRGALPVGGSLVGAAAGSAVISLGGILLVFAKIGCIIFGSGYVLLAFLRSDLVVERHWLSESQLLDAVAVGQVTPGPVFTTATFIGYLLRGPLGALLATIGIFSPAFVFVAAAGPIVRRLRSSKMAAAMLDSLNVASLALMGYVTYELARTAIIDWPTLALALISAVLLVALKTPSIWLLAAGAVLGLAVKG